MNIFEHHQPQVTSGIDRCVVYFYDKTTHWNGVVSIEGEYLEQGDVIVYVDGVKRRMSVTGTDYSSSITCYTFDDDILEKPFGMTYRVFTNQEQNEYELHLVYGCRASLSRVVQQTESNEVNISGFEIDISTTPVDKLAFLKPVSHLIIRTKGIWSQAIEHIEEVLYGTTEEDPKLPSVEEVVDILENYVWLKITDEGDGTWTATEMNGVTDIIEMVSETEFAIDWASGNYIDEQTFTIHSL